MKLDLLNSRMEDPKSNRVFDSLDYADLRSASHPSQHTVRMQHRPTPSRKNQSRVDTLPAQFYNAAVNNEGDIIPFEKRPLKSLVDYNVQLNSSKSTSNGNNSFPSSSSMTHNTAKEKHLTSMSMPDFMSLIGEVTGSQNIESPVGKKFFAPRLDVIKDKVHDDFSHTIAKRLSSENIPGPRFIGKSFKHDEAASSSANLGPGCYNPKTQLIDLPAVIINPRRIWQSEEKGDILPIQEVMRRERQKATLDSITSQFHRFHKEKKAKDPNARSVFDDDNLDPELIDALGRRPKLFLRSAAHQNSSGFLTSVPRFSTVGGPVKVETYAKTTGMLLSPSFDANYDKHIGPKFGDASRDPPPNKNGEFLDAPDVMQYYSLVNETMRSPRKYAAIFTRTRNGSTSPSPDGRRGDRSPSPIAAGTVIKFDATGSIENLEKTSSLVLGPGAFYPTAFPPSVVVKEPQRPMPIFMEKKHKSKLQDILKRENEEKQRIIDEKMAAARERWAEHRVMQAKQRQKLSMDIHRKKK